jgi:small subunit ribosomal protein S3
LIEKTFVIQGIKKLEIDDYLAKELDKAGFTKSEIMKTPLVTRIVVNVTRPGLAIGKSGSNIQTLTETIAKKFGIDNPQLEIREIQNAELDAQAVANKIKALIEKGFSWRSVVFKSLQDVKKAGAQGVEIIVSGKITGKAGRKKKMRFADGYMKKIGEQARLVDYGAASAYPKVGAIGIKVRIVKPNTIFQDKLKIEDYIKKKEQNDSVEPKQEAESSGKEQKDENAKPESERKESENTKPEEKEKKKVKNKENVKRNGAETISKTETDEIKHEVAKQ